jgi:hypothetical protein
LAGARGLSEAASLLQHHHRVADPAEKVKHDNQFVAGEQHRFVEGNVIDPQGDRLDARENVGEGIPSHPTRLKPTRGGLGAEPAGCPMRLAAVDHLTGRLLGIRADSAAPRPSNRCKPDERFGPWPAVPSGLLDCQAASEPDPSQLLMWACRPSGVVTFSAGGSH